MIPQQLRIRPDPAPLAHNEPEEVETRISRHTFIIELSDLIVQREPEISKHLSKGQIVSSVDAFLRRLAVAGQMEGKVRSE